MKPQVVHPTLINLVRHLQRPQNYKPRKPKNRIAAHHKVIDFQGTGISDSSRQAETICSTSSLARVVNLILYGAPRKAFFSKTTKYHM